MSSLCLCTIDMRQLSKLKLKQLTKSARNLHNDTSVQQTFTPYNTLHKQFSYQFCIFELFSSQSELMLGH